MRRINRPGLWAILILAVAAYAYSPTFIPTAAGQAQDDEPKSKSPSSLVVVKGKVVDRDGKGVANAEITFSGPMAAKTTTDSRGSFTQKVAPGKYNIKAKAGAKSKSIQAEVGRDSSDVSLILD